MRGGRRPHRGRQRGHPLPGGGVLREALWDHKFISDLPNNSTLHFVVILSNRTHRCFCFLFQSEALADDRTSEWYCRRCNEIDIRALSFSEFEQPCLYNL
jgi:hypothetical protein